MISQHIELVCNFIYEMYHIQILICDEKLVPYVRFPKTQSDQEQIDSLIKQKSIEDVVKLALEKQDLVILTNRNLLRFAGIPFVKNNKQYILIYGAHPINQNTITQLIKNLSKNLDANNAKLLIDYYKSISELPLDDFNYATKLFYFCLYERTFEGSLSENSFNQNDITQEDFFNKVTSFNNETSDYALKMYYIESFCHNYIKQGDINNLSSFLNQIKSQLLPTACIFTESLGLQGAIIAISAITVARRAAVEAGLDMGVAISMFSIYIERLMNANKDSEISFLIYSMYLDFASQVNERLFQRHYTTNIVKTIQIIHFNLKEHLSINDLAKEVGLSKNYLISQFIKETGISIVDYIKNARINEAKQLLKLTDTPIIEISEMLNFSTQSYFTNTFKEIVGVTPKRYRNQEIIEF